MVRFAGVIGEVLRTTREERGLTLRDLELRSGGAFKPSVLGGYERGERSISLERFCKLADLYDIPADRLLARVLRRLRPEGREEVVIDLHRLARLEGEGAELVTRYIDGIRSQREDRGARVITLRSGDLEELALSARVRPRTLTKRLRSALARGRTKG